MAVAVAILQNHMCCKLHLQNLKIYQEPIRALCCCALPVMINHFNFFLCFHMFMSHSNLGSKKRRKGKRLKIKKLKKEKKEGSNNWNVELLHHHHWAPSSLSLARFKSWARFMWFKLGLRYGEVEVQFGPSPIFLFFWILNFEFWTSSLR